MNRRTKRNKRKTNINEYYATEVETADKMAYVESMICW